MLRFLCLTACLAVSAAMAQPLPVAPLPAGMAAPRIDGRLDDPAWALAPPFTAFRRFRPDAAADPAPYRSEARLLIEPGALVFALRAWEPEPEAIRALLTRRDQVGLDQDSFTVWIDPSGRGEVAQFLRVNAAGSVSDGLYAAAVDEEDPAPDFHDVEVAAQRLSDGYSLEIRWPLANLRFPVEGGRPWALMITRRVPRGLPLSFASSPRLTRESGHLLVGLLPLADEAPLRAQLQDARHAQLKLEATLRSVDGRVKGNLGAELQWRPRARSSTLVVDALLRPDFSQVELDEPQLSGNSRFALFQTEKRAFFLESSDVVGQVPPDGWDVSRGLLAFYSRAVADPRWGLRATQRGESLEGTALLMRDAGGGSLLRADAFGTQSFASEQASTLLFARQRLSFATGLALAPLLSVRDWGDGARGAVVGLDALWQDEGAWQWRGHWLRAEDRTRWDEAAQRLRAADAATQADALWLQARWREGDWRVQGDWEHIAPGFVNDNGFVPQAGIERRHVDLLRAFHVENGAISAWELMLRAISTQALRDPARGVDQAQTASQALQPGFWIAGPQATYVFGHWNEERQRARPGGRMHAPRSLFLGLESFPGQRITKLVLEATLGERVDSDADRVGRGHQLFALVGVRQPLGEGGRNLELEQRWGAGRVKTPSGEPALDEFNAQTKLVLHLSSQQALRWVWQVQRLRRIAEPGLLGGAHERQRTGTLTWLAREGPLRGWSLGLAWSREDGAPVRRETFLKYQQGWAGAS